MGPKHKRCICSKEAENVMNLSQKLELLDQLSRDDSAASMARHYGINE